LTQKLPKKENPYLSLIIFMIIATVIVR
jgi:hypothetical protein